jgi:hypothetical protein
MEISSLSLRKKRLKPPQEQALLGGRRLLEDALPRDAPRMRARATTGPKRASVETSPTH